MSEARREAAELLAGVDNQERRRIQRRAMAGREPTADEQTRLDADMPRLEENSARLGEAGVMTAIPYGGIARAVTAAPRLTGAAAAAWGLLNNSKDAEPGSSDLNEIKKSLVSQGSPELTRLQKEIDSLNQQIATANSAEVKGSAQMRARNEQTAPMQRRLDELTPLYEAERQRIEKEAGDRSNSVMEARSAGEAARDRERGKVSPTFSQAYENTRKEMPVLPPQWALPFAMGAGGVAASKALGVPSAWLGRLRAEKALNAGNGERAAAFADAHAPEGIGAFTKDMGKGAIFGVSGGTMPLGADLATQPAYNPEKAAQNAYVGELLDIDPRKAAAMQLASSLPDKNPAREAATSPGNWLMNALGGAIEGAAGGKMAGALVDAAKPTFSNVRAATKKTGGGGNGDGPGDNPQKGPLSDTNGKYPAAGDPARDHIRSEYREDVLHRGTPFDPREASSLAQAEAARQGGSLPSITSRVKETNSNIEAFRQQNGRLPISEAEWAEHVWRPTRTLAVPVAGGLGYSISQPSEDDLPTTREGVARMLAGY